jgi:polyvinyl alcohol dehydrogenase (cytochrome)
MPGGPLGAQSPDGAQVFRASCASCHTGEAGARAPAADALRSRSPEAILEILVNGAMRAQGAKLTGSARRAVAEFITGRTIGGDVTGAATGRCTARAAFEASSRTPRWSGWSPTAANTRFQTSEAAGLSATEVPRLALRWAFGFPDASSAWAQPTIAGGRVFVGSQNGTVYSLDATTGCIHWTFSAGGGVRTAVTIGASAGGARELVYFGDTAAQAYALDAATGALVWRQKVDEHPLARVTGTPTLAGGRLFVPVSSYEESQGADPQYRCCTFRGSVVALDSRTGAVAWKRYMVAGEPKPRGTSAAGVALFGPSGSAIWSAPAYDAKRRLLYVATGNTYSGPPQPSSDAVVAIDAASGTIRWTRQVTPADIYVTGCRAGNPNCPDAPGPDFDFGSPPIIATLPGGRDLIVIGQKSGVGYAMDPEKQGAIVWQYRAGQGSALGGIEWGSAVDGTHVYFAVSDILQPQPGGLHAVELATGERVWLAPPATPKCSGRGCNAAQSAALTAIPGIVFSGSNDGVLRAYSTVNGQVVWEFDSNREFPTVNGVPARGASMIGPGPAIAGGMLFVNSGYGAFGGRTGNVLLAFGVE